jgi:hypothetical protein
MLARVSVEQHALVSTSGECLVVPWVRGHEWQQQQSFGRQMSLLRSEQLKDVQEQAP